MSGSEVYAPGDVLELTRHYPDAPNVEYWPGGRACVAGVHAGLLTVHRWRPGPGIWTQRTYRVAARWGWKRVREISPRPKGS